MEQSDTSRPSCFTARQQPPEPNPTIPLASKVFYHLIVAKKTFFFFLLYPFLLLFGSFQRDFFFSQYVWCYRFCTLGLIYNNTKVKRYFLFSLFHFFPRLSSVYISLSNNKKDEILCHPPKMRNTRHDTRAGLYICTDAQEQHLKPKNFRRL